MAAAEKSRLAVAALAFAVAAALSSWNPLSAPFGLAVGVASLVLSVRALRRPVRRRIAAGALAVSIAAVVASGLVLGLTAGVGRELGGSPVVQRPPPGDTDAELKSAGERTRPARDRARSELEQLGGERPPDRKDADRDPRR